MSEFWETKRVVSHEEAKAAARRLINSHFRNEDSARLSIPANPDRDDDLVLLSYIAQRQRGDEAAEVAIESRVGGAYKMPDGRTFWVDAPVAREIARRANGGRT